MDASEINISVYNPSGNTIYVNELFSVKLIETALDPFIESIPKIYSYPFIHYDLSSDSLPAFHLVALYKSSWFSNGIDLVYSFKEHAYTIEAKGVWKFNLPLTPSFYNRPFQLFLRSSVARAGISLSPGAFQSEFYLFNHSNKPYALGNRFLQIVGEPSITFNQNMPLNFATISFQNTTCNIPFFIKLCKRKSKCL